MSQITILHSKNSAVPLTSKPSAALFAIGIHGPTASEEFFMNAYWTLHLYTYDAEITIDDAHFAIRPGYATVLPPGTRSIYRFPQRSIHACSHFAFPEGDAGSIAMPLIQDLGQKFGETYEALEGAIACFRNNPLQAEVRLWDILWRLTAQAPARAPGDLIKHEHHPAVRRAQELIDVNLASLMPVSAIADAVDLSHNQLTRLFRAEFGTTVIGYIQQQRASRAKHLLEHTQLPIKTIAAQVGMEDARLFNKLIHDTLGGSPTEVRNRLRVQESPS